MPLILAIEPDRRQASRLAALARPLKVDLLVTESVARALETLADRTPDVVLTPLLMSPKDETALAERLRELDAAGMRVQTLTIPVLATGRRSSGSVPGAGLLTRLRRSSRSSASPQGCDPAVFAAQISEYLERAAADRDVQAAKLEDDQPYDAHLIHRGSRNKKAAHQSDPVKAAGTHAVVSAPTFEQTVLADFEQTEIADAEQIASVEDADPVTTTPAFEPIELAPVPEAFESFAAEPVLDSISQLETRDDSTMSDGAMIDVAETFDAAAADAGDTGTTWAEPETPLVVAERVEPVALPAPMEFVAPLEPVASTIIEPVANAIIQPVAHAIVEPVVAVRAERRAPALEALERVAREHAHLGTRPLAHLEAILEAAEGADATTVASDPPEEVVINAEPIDLAAFVRELETAPVEDTEDFDTFVVDVDPDRDLWMPLPLTARAAWPQVEGPHVRTAYATPPPTSSSATAVASAVGATPVAATRVPLADAYPTVTGPEPRVVTLADAIAAAPVEVVEAVDAVEAFTALPAKPVAAQAVSSAIRSTPTASIAVAPATPRPAVTTPVVAVPAVTTPIVKAPTVTPRQTSRRVASTSTSKSTPSTFAQTRVEGFAGSRLSEAAAIEAALAGHVHVAPISVAPVTVAPAPPEAIEPELPGPDPLTEFSMPARTGAKKRSRRSAPVQDEWGFFDPLQCGFAALLDKLEEITKKEESKRR